MITTPNLNSSFMFVQDTRDTSLSLEKRFTRGSGYGKLIKNKDPNAHGFCFQEGTNKSTQCAVGTRYQNNVSLSSFRQFHVVFIMKCW